MPAARTRLPDRSVSRGEGDANCQPTKGRLRLSRVSLGCAAQSTWCLAARRLAPEAHSARPDPLSEPYAIQRQGGQLAHPDRSPATPILPPTRARFDNKRCHDLNFTVMSQRIWPLTCGFRDPELKCHVTRKFQCREMVPEPGVRRPIVADDGTPPPYLHVCGIGC